MRMRDEKVDILKGIGMLCVIMGHLTQVGLLKSCIYSFHMPLFFMLSGYFYSPQDTKTLAVKMAKSLLIPYLIVAVIIASYKYSLSEVIDTVVFADGYHSHTLIWNSERFIGTLWFLPALFWCRIVYNTLGKSKYATVMALAISVFSYFLGKYIINIPLGLLEGTQALVFYAAGYYLKFWNDYSKICLCVCFLIWSVSIYIGGLSMADFSYRCYPLNVAGAICGVFIIYKVISVIKDRVINLSAVFKYIAWIGKNSLYFLCIHALLQVFDLKYNWLIALLFQMTICTMLTLFYLKLEKCRNEKTCNNG